MSTPNLGVAASSLALREFSLPVVHCRGSGTVRRQMALCLPGRVTAHLGFWFEHFGGVTRASSAALPQGPWEHTATVSGASEKNIGACGPSRASTQKRNAHLQLRMRVS
jgi:hypothetical protein